MCKSEVTGTGVRLCASATQQAYQRPQLVDPAAVVVLLVIEPRWNLDSQLQQPVSFAVDLEASKTAGDGGAAEPKGVLQQALQDALDGAHLLRSTSMLMTHWVSLAGASTNWCVMPSAAVLHMHSG